MRPERETSEQFGVGIGLRQGSALSPLLFIMVMSLISGKVSEQEELKKILYADNLAVVADNKDLQKTLQEWSNTFRKHCLRLNLEKTEVMWIGEQEVDLHVVVDGKTIKQVNSLVYLGGTVCEDGGSSKEIQRREQAGAAAWRRREGIIWDRKLKKQLKGEVLEACGTILYIQVGNTGTDRETG